MLCLFRVTMFFDAWLSYAFMGQKASMLWYPRIVAVVLAIVLISFDTGCSYGTGSYDSSVVAVMTVLVVHCLLLHLGDNSGQLTNNVAKSGSKADSKTPTKPKVLSAFLCCCGWWCLRSSAINEFKGLQFADLWIFWLLRIESISDHCGWVWVPRDYERQTMTTTLQPQLILLCEMLLVVIL